MKQFENKVVVVTGSTRGIGKSIVAAFAQAGAITVVVGRSVDLVAKVVDELSTQGGKVEGVVCDVTKMENVQELLNKVLDKHKAVDILINNAGITKDNLILRMGEDDWDDVMAVNLRGVFNCTKVFVKPMLKAKSGRIINISSIIGIKGNAGQANYAASKAGMIGFTKSIALEIASRNITVNAIAPGYIQTEMTAQLKDKTREGILQKIPMKRLGETQDIAHACLFLASKYASYITGQTLVVDGGMAI